MKLKMMLIALLSMAPIFGLGDIFQGVQLKGKLGAGVNCDDLKTLKESTEKDLAQVKDNLEKLKAQRTGFLPGPHEADIKNLENRRIKLEKAINFLNGVISKECQ